MKRNSILGLFLFFTIFLVYCTKNDQVVTSSSSSTNVLNSVKTSTAPVIDGTIDAVWANATKLSFSPTVPDPGNGLFTGYNGEQYPTTLRSMYDDSYIYFLAEWADAGKSVNNAPWYFNPTTKLWAQEPSSKSLDQNGNVTRTGFGEDKFAMLFNIDNSCQKFLTQTCYGSCHIFTPYMDYSVTPAVEKSNANNGNHYTNGQFEKIDMWWGKLGYIASDASNGYMDDNYQDYAGGPAVTNLTGGSANGRHVDGIYIDSATTYKWPNGPHYTTSPNQGEVKNSQNLKLDGTGSSVAVPMWVYKGVSNAGFVLVADTSNGKAVKVTGVASTGVLTLSDGSSIDPTATTDYQRPAEAVYGIEAKTLPAYFAQPLIGGRKDIPCAAVYTGSGWVVEYKRLLKTTDGLKQDVDFTANNYQDQPFGFAIWNQSNNQHGINPNLVLHFAK
ncbi:MAG: ethylbenzene dehydrogenase-related protein [Bacteroidota bacterium]